MERLRLLRTDKGIHQEELGSILDLSQQAISAYENGTKQPPIDILIRIADFFDVSVDYLLERTNIRKHGDAQPEDRPSQGLLSDPELRVILSDCKEWTHEDKQELISYLKAKKIARKAIQNKS